MTPVIIMSRVSTRRQETDRQVSDLTAAALAKGWEVVEVIEEKVSGRKDEKDRPDLQRARELVAAGRVKKVMVHEISRLSRKNSVLHKFVEDMADAGVSVYWHAQKQETLMEDGKRDPMAAMMLAFMSEQARRESEQTSERILSGLENARRNGKVLGRREGVTEPVEKFLSKHRDVTAIIQRRPSSSVRELAARTKKSTATIAKIKRILRAA